MMGATTVPGHRRSPRFLGGYHTLAVLVLMCFQMCAADTCKTGCESSTQSGKLKFVPGTVYNYDLNSLVTVRLTGNDEQFTKLEIHGQAQLYAESNCQYTLRLQKLIVLGPDNKKNELNGELQANRPVRFTLDNDAVAPQICAETEDTEFALNLKRAIISLIQSADTKSVETDVFGVCPTTFASTQAGSTLIVSKTRNLNDCGHRESLTNGLISGVLDESSGVKSTPLLHGDYNKEQQITDGILSSVVLTEEYSFVPFSSATAGAKASVLTKLTLKGKSSEAAPKQAAVTEARTLLFENPDEQTLANEEKLKAALKNTADTYNNNVGPKAAGQFTELIRLMRFAKKTDLLQLYQQIKSGTVHTNKSLSRKIYLDALFRTGSSESVEVIAELVKKELDPKEKRLAFYSFNLVNSLNKPALASINKLLDANPPKEAYLSVGSLVHKYCRKHGCESNEIKSISEKFVKKLGNCKADTRQQEDIVVSILKGIRNTNNLIEPALDKVVHCTGDKFNTRIRVAALQALSAAAPNNAKIHATALELLKNRELDAELRIEAYLVLVDSPTGVTANEIKSLLDDEPVQQVGAFITSHLASLRSSTDPTRESARQHFANVRTTNKFPVDIRRYSFNREFSYAIGSLGVGAGAESSVIYSQKSFLPRSARLNVTGEIFGNNFNLFELAGRQENIDLLLEHNFGPKGVFNTADLGELYAQFTKGDENVRRSRRSTREDITKFADTVHLDDDESSLNDIHFDLSVKLFGTEMYFLSLGDNLSVDPKAFVKKVKSIVAESLREAKRFSHKLESHVLFLDADLAYPTGVGFPLKLVAQGTAVARLEASGEIDIKKILASPKDTKFTVKVVPSYNVEVTGTLSVDAWAVAAGLQVSGSVHSSTGSEVDFKLSKTTVDVNVRLPLKKQEIFSFDHKIVFILQERNQETVRTPLKFSSKKKEYTGCFDQLSNYIGVTFCGETSITTPASVGVALFPLNGPNRAAVWLEVEQEYSFSAAYSTKSNAEHSLQIQFDTPNSTPNRIARIIVDTSTLEGQVFYRVTLQSPHVEYALETGYTNNNKEVALYVKASTKSDKWLAKIGFEKAAQGASQEYTPILLFQTPDKSGDSAYGYKVTGKVLVNGGKYTFKNVQLIGNEPLPLSVNGWIELRKAALAIDLVLAMQGKQGTIVGELEFSPTLLKTDLTIKTPFHEYANGKLELTLENKAWEQVKNNLKLVYGSDLNSKTNSLHLINEYDVVRTPSKSVESVTFKNSIDAPFVQAKLRVDGAYNKNLVKYALEAGLGKHSVASNLDAKLNGKTVGDYDVKFDAKVNTFTVTATGTREILGDLKSKLTNTLTTSFGTKIDVNAVVSEQFNAQNAELNLDALVILGDEKDKIKLDFVVLVTPKLANSNAKLTVGKNDLVHYDAKLVRDSANNNGELDIEIKDLLSGKGTFKSTNGVGDGSLLLNIQKIDRKVKLVSKFNIAAPKYDVRNEFYYDFEKDNAKKIVFDTKNQLTKNKVDSKNTLELFEEKYQFNVQTTRSGDLKKGKIDGKFSLTLPNERTLSGEVNRDANLKDASGSVSANIKLTDTLPDKKSRSLAVVVKLTDYNYKEKIFNFLETITYTDFESKTIILDAHIKNQPNGHFRVGSVSVVAKGTLLPEVWDVLISADEYCSEHAKYTVTAKYGGQASINVNGNYYVGGRGKPATYEFNGALNVPNTKLNTIKLSSNGRYLAPVNEDGIFEGLFKVQGTVNEKTIALDTTAKGNRKHGSASVNVVVPDTDPISAETTYAYEKVSETVSAKVTGQINYGKGKTIKLSADAKGTGKQELSVHASLATPFEQGKSIDLIFKHLRSNDHTFTSATTLKVDDKSYTLHSVLGTSEQSPSVELVLSYPNKEIKFEAAVVRLGNRKFNTKLNIVNFGDFNFASTTDVSYQSTDNFYLKVDVDSAKLKLNKVHLELNSKVNAGTKGVEFKASADNKNVLAGNADFNVFEDKGKTVIEGQGNVKLYEELKAASFKFIRTNFEEARDGETGNLYVINVYFGAKSSAAEVKLTNRNFHVKHTLCESKEQCTNLEVKSSLKLTDLQALKHELLIAVDLRKLGYAHEFGLKAETNRNGFQFDHTFDLHLQSQDKTKYQYSLYVHPSKAGVVLTLPSRTLSVESVYTLPTNQVFGKYEASVSTYLDKKGAPNNKAAIVFNGEVIKAGENTFRTKGALVFSHPKVKDLKISGQSEFNGPDQQVSGKVELDIFKKPDQLILIVGKFGNSDSLSYKSFNVSSELSVSSRGLGFEYGFNGHAAASLERKQISVAGSLVAPSSDLRVGLYGFSSDQSSELIVTGFNEQLVHIVSNFDSTKQQGSFKSTVQFLGAKPIVANVNVDGLSSVTASLVQDKLLNVNAEFTNGKVASLQVQSAGKPLFNGKIVLDQSHFLASEYKIEESNLKEFIKTAQEQIKSDAEKGKQALSARVTRIQDSISAQIKNIKSSVPDLSGIQSNYKQELDNIIEELKKDKAILELVEIFNRVYGTVSKTIQSVYTVLAEHSQKVHAILTEFYTNLQAAYNERILPALKETYGKLEKLAASIYEESVQLITGIVERIAKGLKTFEGDFDKITSSLSSIFKNFAQIVSQNVELVRKELKDVYAFIVENIDQLIGFDSLKQQFKELFGEYILPENIVNLLREISTTLKDGMPTEELKEFVTKLFGYIENKINNKPVKDIDVLKDISLSLYKAVRSIINLVRVKSSDDFSSYLGPIPFSLEAFRRLPSLSSINFSPLNFLRNENLPSIRDLFYNYRPYAFNPLNILPPFEKRAQIADGQNILTFEGKHISFPGNCQYILAQDFVNGNFSLVANLADGKLKSLILLDKENSIELNQNGVVSLNGAAANLPVHKDDIYAWRQYHSVSLLTTYGVRVVCSTDLRVCHVNVNGYYHGKLRGLLGSGNGERYDDFKLPNGKVASSFAEFGNAYRAQKSCAEVPVTEDQHQKSDLCSKTFGYDSNLALGYYFVDVTKYREACEHAVATATDKQDAVCNVAALYVSALGLENIPVKLPSECVKCDEHELGDSYDVTSPQKKADIVLVVDTSLGALLDDLVQSVITDLRAHLKLRHVNDVHLSVIGYNKDQKYLTHFTSNGKLDFTSGKLSAVNFDSWPKVPKPVKTDNAFLNSVQEEALRKWNKLSSDLGLGADGQAFRRALSYPFRGAASKVIIAVRNDQLTHSDNPSKQLGASITNELAKKAGIQIHMIGPVSELTTKDAKNAKNIVGFNNKHVLLVSDAKKVTNVGSADLRTSLKYNTDLGTDLVHESNGYVFNLNNYIAQKSPKEKKQFVRVATIALAESIARTEVSSTCVCTLQDGLFPKESCTVNSVKFLPSIKLAARG